MQNKSHLTAIHRKTLPGPTRWLLKQFPNLGSFRVLDYGCGKAHEINNQFFKADGYDPHFRPNFPTRTDYEIIICNYVLCVLPTEMERRVVLKKIQLLLSENGHAYISVRNDKPDNGHGWTSKGTYQADVHLDLPLVKKTREFRIYKLTKKDKI